MTIWDCFLFHDELDLLECRLRELEDIPGLKHVLVESPQTFQGNLKPLWFAGHKHRFRPWADRIVHVAAPLPGAGSTWDRESAQREETFRGLRDAHPDDVVMHGDVDEIPRRPFIEFCAQTPDLAHVAGMSQHIFAVDWLDPRGSWPGQVALPMRRVESFAQMRAWRNTLPRVENSGWHLTWLGGRRGIGSKAHAFSHTEIVPLVDRANAGGLLYEQGKFWSSLDELGIQLTPVDVDSTWPQWICQRKCPANWFRPR